jgi:aryl-alcohol dehydrogenase-like predicted oxidoreductase
VASKWLGFLRQSSPTVAFVSTRTSTSTRRLGRAGREVSALGLGCWAIGGPFMRLGRASGWGDVDDEESVRAIRRALDLGVTLFDTADVYGCGHSERVLGRALGPNRQRVAIATKFGYTFDEVTRTASDVDVSAAEIRRACEASLRRLGTDSIDLYQLPRRLGIRGGRGRDPQRT